jgi:hypothetical protein
MRTSAPGQSALLMADVAELLATQGIRYAVIGAMAAAVHGVVRASLDADALVALQVLEARTLRQSLIEAGYEAALRIGDADDPIPALLEVRDGHGNRVDMVIGLRGMDPEALNRTRRIDFSETTSVARLRKIRHPGLLGSSLPPYVACPFAIRLADCAARAIGIYAPMDPSRPGGQGP